MVKVYDMVTYEVCEPDDETSAAQTSPARGTDRADLHLQTGLQPLEHGISRCEDPMPPSMRDIDIMAFLSDIDTD